MPDRDPNIARQAMTMLPHSPEPMGHADDTPLLVITETVALTITVGDHPPIRLEVCRLAREPHSLIRPIDPQSMTIVRTDDLEHGYAAYDIKIAAGR